MKDPMYERSVDALTPDWKIIQLKRGHRFSTDDIVLAYRASEAAPNATNLLDIGCGIGTVGLYTLWRLNNPKARLVGVEAQEISKALFQDTIKMNQLEDRVRVIHDDLRHTPHASLTPHAYDLVTGSPPYFPPDSCKHSPHPQRAHARVELRGSLVDYCKTAAYYMAEEGRFCFVMPAGDPRTESAPIAAGFRVLERIDYVFREGSAPMIATLVCGRASETPPEPRVTRSIVIRKRDGEWSDAFVAFRADKARQLR